MLARSRPRPYRQSPRSRRILLAADCVADEPTLMARAVGVIPQLGPRFGIVGVNHATRVRYEHEIARGRQNARERRLGEANLQLLVSGYRVARVEMTINLAARRRRDIERIGVLPVLLQMAGGVVDDD